MKFPVLLVEKDRRTLESVREAKWLVWQRTCTKSPTLRVRLVSCSGSFGLLQSRTKKGHYNRIKWHENPIVSITVFEEGISDSAFPHHSCSGESFLTHPNFIYCPLILESWEASALMSLPPFVWMKEKIKIKGIEEKEIKWLKNTKKIFSFKIFGKVKNFEERK